MTSLRRFLGRRSPAPPKRVPGSFKPRKFPGPWRKLIQALDIDLVLDVGGNVGQYAGGLRSIGFAGRIVSFEPLSSARVQLERQAATDGLWTVMPYALGEKDGETTLHVAGNSGSSSVLDMLDRHKRAAPTSVYVGKERVQVRRLDGLLDTVVRDSASPFLKLDVQGYELAVMRGIGGRLPAFQAIQLELSTVPLYAGAPLRQEVEAFLVGAGFVLAGVLQGFSDPDTGQMLQYDGLFVRKDLLA